MGDIKHFFKENFIQYASYVILDRAIPNIVDGLKPVQRRILWTLFQMDNGKLHKVANVAGQTMALHPHGDAPIVDAMVNMANRGYLLDTQGNFGNSLTGDPPAAARYIETRLGGLAKETLFNPHLTQFASSYDGRAQEPVVLPAKIPILLLQGAEGIAVGMTTKILPHNFTELLQAQIAILEGRPYEILPDFPSGGIMDATEYNQGQGRLKLRAKIQVVDDKTLVIREICYGTTTESLIRSIDEAAKKGKIKIDGINDYTAEKIEIEIKLPRGQYANKTIDALYAFTDCEVTHYPQMIVIKERMPWEGGVNTILEYHTQLLKYYLQTELEQEQAQLLEKIFEKTLEQLFIENRLYKPIENMETYEKVHASIEKGLVPFHSKLTRVPTYEDREQLLAIPIRRISRFDIEKNQAEIVLLQKKFAEAEKNLKQLTKFTIRYIEGLLKKYSPQFPRRTQLKAIEILDKRVMAAKTVRVGYDSSSGFMGSKISGTYTFECSTLDKLLLFYSDGTYCVMNISDKQYIHHKDSTVMWIGIADKKTTIGVIYSNSKKQPYAKQFVVKQFILDKEYRFIEAGDKVEFLSEEVGEEIQIDCVPKGQKKKGERITFSFTEVPIQSVQARGMRISDQSIKKIMPLQSAKAGVKKEVI